MQLHDLLLNKFSVDAQDLQRAISYQAKYSGRLEQILVNMGSLPEDQVSQLLSEYLEIPLFSNEQYANFEPAAIEKPALDVFLAQSWVPLSKQGEHIEFACKDPLNQVMNEWLIKNNQEYTLFIANEVDIQLLISKYEEPTTDLLDDNPLDEEERLKELATEAPTVNLLNSLISRALRQGASDMHLEPYKGRYRARFRVDGVLHEAETISARKQLPIITRLKILSGMDIAEKRRPQDGKIEMKIANQEIDIRVSALPLNDGESVVMRFLRKENVRYDMSVLGLSSDINELILDDIKTTSGVVLLTGPTGSGKTTTLYTFLNALNNDDVKIITLEDPVEYQLPGINQVQVNSDIGFDFSAGLRSVVRQDPDVIMLGEIRDKETAQIALQSALTGHLVFSTVHTNDAASAYTRLLDLGVEEFLLNAALVSIVAQRLARKICDHCAEPEPSAQALIEKYDLSNFAKRFNLPSIELKRGAGCEHCSQTGYKGRMAVTEYLRCDSEIKAMPKNADFIPKAKLHNQSLNRRTLLEDGLYKAVLGQTTIAEVIRVAG
ncbi:GspE/PulE family protein [Pseudoalteromonas sp. APC 3224]|jgi:general secretion pathway protein E|uniref:GspE/PulE family protein n=1 Tax=Pseudoalteromonas sp. APC 3224 TaxID=3035203 RepID=UPI0025B42BE1|nr:GspE/PulE family protein [Pseudoalteromonas sp. APC 3224]MDN3484906.1 GspE/PulE family protein [Pseudoalteromonas sp. APC 3224]|tara:strand:+ start:4379 stop:6028 length:1650 start_codon:yes stop_codon:yes gene_type:complete